MTGDSGLLGAVVWQAGRWMKTMMLQNTGRQRGLRKKSLCSVRPQAPGETQEQGPSIKEGTIKSIIKPQFSRDPGRP